MPEQPKYLSLNNLLTRRLFQIPEYQRGYSWTHRERKHLFDDIEKVFEKGKKNEHFMATIVCHRQEEIELVPEIYSQLDVVDGQQRLSTLILLLNTIKLHLDEKDEKQKRERKKLEELIVKPGEDNLLLLQTNHDPNSYFANYLLKGEKEYARQADTIADREILNAIGECNELVGKWKDKLIELYACINNQLSFLLHEIPEEKTVYTVFEVLNSRGKAVSWLDRLKSSLMGSAFALETDTRNLISELHDIWRKIYTEIGLNERLDEETLQFAATLYKSDKTPSRLLSEEDAVEKLREAKDARQIREVARWILKVAKACNKVRSNRRQNAVTEISHARLLSVAIHLKNGISSAERQGLLYRWEKTTFRIYGLLGNDARTRVGDYVRLAWRLMNEEIPVKRIHTEMRQIGADFRVKVTGAEKTFGYKNDIRIKWYEERKEELRYIFFRYEEFLANKEGIHVSKKQWDEIWRESPSNTIEHIMPQSEKEEYINNIGNLMILPSEVNRELGNKLPKEKREGYSKSGLLIANKVISLIDSTPAWPKKSIHKREKEIWRWAAKEWAD